MCVLAASARWIPAAMAGTVEPAMPLHRRPVAELHLLISFKRKGSICKYVPPTFLNHIQKMLYVQHI